jgi:SAM-dependent methyltransferase
MVYTRYRFAAECCRGRRVLEVACGPGVGLVYLGRQAEAIVGGDLTESLLRQAHRSVQGATPLVRLQSRKPCRLRAGVPRRDRLLTRRSTFSKTPTRS